MGDNFSSPILFDYSREIKGGVMIRAILKKGKIQPLDKLPQHWRDGQELIVEGCDPSDDPADIKKWYEQLVALSAQIPAVTTNGWPPPVPNRTVRQRSGCATTWD